MAEIFSIIKFVIVCLSLVGIHSLLIKDKELEARYQNGQLSFDELKRLCQELETYHYGSGREKTLSRIVECGVDLMNLLAVHHNRIPYPNESPSEFD